VSGTPRAPILVTGATGQVGAELLRTLAPLGTVLACDRRRLDLGDPDAIRRVLRELAPGLVVNAAAYTAVDRAEEEPHLAHAINALAPGVIAEELARRGGALVHLSTDYVFDGESSRPYREDDRCAPINVYGRSKRAGEEAALSAGGAVLVVRTSWVYGLRGRNFLLAIQRLARSRERLQVVADQVGSPTWSRALAEAIAQLLARLGTDPGRLREHTGLLHLCCAGQASWFDLARAILAATAGTGQVTVEPIDTAGYPTRAARPRYSVLDCRRAAERLGIRMPPWEQALEQALEDQRIARESLTEPAAARA